MEISIESAAARAKKAARSVMLADTEAKNKALSAISESIRREVGAICAENKKDVENARQNGMKDSLVDRLTLTPERLFAIAESIGEIAKLPDPIGEVMDEWSRPNGLLIKKVRVPMGVIGIIYEARPNVTCDAAALCLKAGSAVMLRGGSDAVNSNIKLVEVMRNALEDTPIDPDAVMMSSDLSRSGAEKMMKLNGLIDVLIPRGGAGLIKSVVNNATLPVVETGTGNCHIFVDESADFAMAENIIINAKTQRTGVCNAAESMLVHEKIAEKFLPHALEALRQKGCEIRGCERTKVICPWVNEAEEADYGTEYLDLILSVKVVRNVDEAIAHIEKYSTHHSETIVTESKENAEKFMREVNSAAVYHNASTRFTDGGEFGFGAEMGISTQKLHARGPMGLREITSYKYVVEGEGQIR